MPFIIGNYFRKVAGGPFNGVAVYFANANAHTCKIYYYQTMGKYSTSEILMSQNTPLDRFVWVYFRHEIPVKLWANFDEQLDLCPFCGM